MTRSLGRIRRGLILAAVAVLGSSAAAAPPAPVQTPSGSGQPIATLAAKRGAVTVIRLGRSEPATLSMPLELDDIVWHLSELAEVRLTVSPELRAALRKHDRALSLNMRSRLSEVVQMLSTWFEIVAFDEDKACFVLKKSKKK